MPREITWSDIPEIGIQLQEKFPELDPLFGALYRPASVRYRAAWLRWRSY